MPPIILDQLTKHYRDVVGIDGLSFTVREGEIFGFLGPNGAGKTTCIRTLLGLMHPTSGDAHLLGESIRDEGAHTRVRHRIGYIPASLSFEEDRTGEDVLDLFAAFRGDTRREELLDHFNPPLQRRVREYSTGNKQMLAIVQAFMHEPDVVIMDEPTSGLDPLKQEHFYRFLDKERRKGTTIFFSSHVLSEVRRVCDRVGLLRAGKLVALQDIEALVDQGGKQVTIRFEDGHPPPDLDLHGITNLRSVGQEHQFDYTGDVPTLLRTLVNFQVADLTIQEPPLEDVFMHFYGEQDPPESRHA